MTTPNTFIPQVPSPIRDHYIPTGKKNRLANRAEPGQLASVVLAGVLSSIDVSKDIRASIHDLSPDTCGFKPAVRTRWQESLADAVARAFACRIRWEKGNSLTILGDAQLADPARWLIGRLIDDVADFSNRDYLRVFYQKRGEGKVEEAQGERARILDEIQARMITALGETQVAADSEVFDFLSKHAEAVSSLMTSDNTPTRRSRTLVNDEVQEPSEAEKDKARRLRALQAALDTEQRFSTKVLPDEDLARIYGPALKTAHDMRPDGPAVGVAFYTGVKNFSISASVMAATDRLGEPPTRFKFHQGYLYLSADSANGTTLNGWSRVLTTAGSPS